MSIGSWPLPEWRDLTYLKSGNERQRAAYDVLRSLAIFEQLRAYNPILVGTIPIDVDIPGSDLDVICEASDPERFVEDVRTHYEREDRFHAAVKDIRGERSAVARFTTGGFPIELFAQSRSVTEQNAYRHMLVEARLLAIGGARARQEIRRLKRGGLKTEPAFAACFRLPGDPYQALFDLYPLSDAELREVINL